MEPLHIYALLHRHTTEEDHRTRLEQHFAARHLIRTTRRERVRRVVATVQRRVTFKSTGSTALGSPSPRTS